MAVETLEASLDHLIVPTRRVVRRKTPEELAAQVAQAETILREPFFRDHERTAEALALDTEELKQRYPRRYADYLKLLAEIHHLKRENYRLARAELGDEFMSLPADERADFVAPTSAQLAQLKDLIDRDHEVVSARVYLRMVANLEAYMERYEPDHSQPGPLREHQQDVCHDFSRFLNSDNSRRGYIDMPTGTGKTAVFVELIEALAGHPLPGQKAPIKTLVIVPTKDLIGQTIGDDKRGFRAFAPDLQVTSYYEKQKDLSGDVVITTYDSFLTLVRAGTITVDMFDLIITDEAHHTLGEGTRVTIDELMKRCPKALLVGFTATTEYSQEEYRHLRSVFGTEIHRLGLIEAINRGILAPVEWDYFVTDPEMLKDFRGRFVRGNDYSPAVLRQLDNQERNRRAVEYVQQALLSGRQTLVSCLPMDRQTSVRHLETMAELINAAQIQLPRLHPDSGQPIPGEFVTAVARAIDGNMSENEREQILTDYRAGLIHVLTFVDILKEGIDLPDAKALINLRPTLSPVLARQRLGRILRPNGQRAWVVEFRDRLGQTSPYDMERILADDASDLESSVSSGESRRSSRLSSSENAAPEVTMGSYEIRGGSLGEMDPVPVAIDSTFVRPDEADAKVYRDGTGDVWLSYGVILERFGLTRAYLAELLSQGGVVGVLKNDQIQPAGRHLLYSEEEIRLLLSLAPEIQNRGVSLGGERWLDAKGIADWLRSTREDIHQIRIQAVVGSLLEMYFGEVVRVLPARRPFNGAVERYDLVYSVSDLTRWADQLAEWLIYLAAARRQK